MHTYDQSASTQPGSKRYLVWFCLLFGLLSLSVLSNAAHAVSTPTGLSAPSLDIDGSNFQVTWSSVTDADLYQLQRRKNNGAWSTIHSHINTYKWQNGLGEGTYDYRVRACLGSDCSDYSGSVRTIVDYKPSPSGWMGLPTTDTDGTFDITFGGSGGASSYKLQRKSSTGSWSTIKTTSHSNRSHREVSLSNGIWSYRVISCTSNNVCSDPSTAKTITVKRPPATPTGFSADDRSTDGIVSMQWNDVTGEDNYWIVRDGELFDSTTDRYKTFYGIEDGVYEFWVVACVTYNGHNFCSPATQKETVVVQERPPAPTGLSVPAQSEDGFFTVQWNTVSVTTEGSVFYRLWQRYQDGVYVPEDINGTSKAYQGLANGVYDFYVQACIALSGEEFCGNASSVSTTAVHPEPDTPTNFSIVSATTPPKSDDGVVTLDWDAVPGADTYVIWENGQIKELVSDPQTHFSLQGVPNGTHNYRINACVTVGEQNVCGDATDALTVIVQRPPGDVTGLVLPEWDEDGTFEVIWDPVNLADSYKIWWASPSTGGFVDTSNDPSYEFTDLADESYNFAVQACIDRSGESFCGEALYDSFVVGDVHVPPPSNLATPNGQVNSGSAYTITWNVSAEATIVYLWENKVGEVSSNDGIYTYDRDSGTIAPPEDGGGIAITCPPVGQAGQCSATVTGRGDGVYEYSVNLGLQLGGQIFNSAGIGPITVTVGDPAPQVPSNFRATATEVSSGGVIELKWEVEASVTHVALAENPFNGGGASTHVLNRESGVLAGDGDHTGVSINCPVSSTVQTCTAQLTGRSDGGYAFAAFSTVIAGGNTYYGEATSIIDVFVGNKVPPAPTNFTITESLTEGGNIVASWNVVAGTRNVFLWENTSDNTNPYHNGIFGYDRVTKAFLPEVVVDPKIDVSCPDFRVAGQCQATLRERPSGTYNYRVSQGYVINGTREDGPVAGPKPVQVHPADVSEGIPAAPLIAAASLPASASVTDSDEIGTTAGTFRVNESGAATYSVPIFAVQGAAGVTPQLALNYSSTAGNGLLGKGWSLSGTSGITRCRQTRAVDGQAKPISLTDEDRLCLDGQRLIVVQGTYWAEDSEYRTEIDGFAYVTLETVEDGRAVTFTVERKDGSKSTYGESSVSSNAIRQFAGGEHYAWMLSRFEDSKGNGIDFKYEHPGSGDHRLQEVQYAFAAPGTSNSPGAKITLAYEARPDVRSGYIAGYPNKLTERLASISVENGNTTVRTYTLTYSDASGGVGENPTSLLASIEECALGVCLPATTFDWVTPEAAGPAGEFVWEGRTYTYGGNSGFGIETSSTSALPMEDSDTRVVADYRFADFNADGLLDIVWVERKYEGADVHATRVLSALATSIPDPSGSGAAGQVQYGTARLIYKDSNNHTNYTLEVLDYNVDGRQDVLLSRHTSDSALIFLSEHTGSGWNLPLATSIVDHGGIDLGFQASSMRVADVNSDGLADLVVRESDYETVSEKLRLLARNGNPDTSSQAYGFGSESLNFSLNYTTPAAILANPTGPVAKVVDYVGQSLGATDFNGDGLSDALIKVTYKVLNDPDTNDWSNTNSTCHIMVAEEDGSGLTFNEYLGADVSPITSSTEVVPGTYCRYGTYMPYDANADGLTDILMRSTGDTWKLALNNGNGFEALVDIQLPGLDTAGRPQPYDYNQDGYPDLAWHDADDNQMNVILWDPAQEVFDPTETKLIDTAAGREDDVHLFTDISGDGVADYINVAFISGNTKLNTYMGKGEGQPRYVINHITNGIGAKTEVTYGSMATSGHYAREDVNTISSPYCVNLPSGSAAQNWCQSLDSADIPAFYTALNQGNDPAKPTIPFVGPVSLVTSVSSSAPVFNNAQAMSTIDYYYAGAKVQAAGRGFLGFEQLRTIDRQTDIETVTQYHQLFPYTGMAERTETRLANGNLLSRADNTFSDSGTGCLTDKVRQPFVSQSIEDSWATISDANSLSVVDPDPSGHPEKRVITTTARNDCYGNASEVIVATKTPKADGSFEHFQQVKTTSTYDSDEAKQFARVARTVVETSRKDQGAQVRTASFAYEAKSSGGLLIKETVEPDSGSTNLWLETTYSHDAFGNVIQKTVTGNVTGDTVGTRTASWVYEDNGRFLKQEKNHYGQIVSEVTARNDLGLPIQTRQMSGVVVDSYYGAFGRPYYVYESTGASSQTLFKSCVTEICPSSLGAVYMVEQLAGGGAQSRAYYDALGREVRSATLQFNGLDWGNKDTAYDNLGRVARTSVPYIPGQGSAQWTINTYDLLGRVVRVNHPHAAAHTTMAYDGLTVTSIDPEGKGRKETRNLLGELTKVEDVVSDDTPVGVVTYTYDIQGNLKTVIQPSGATMTMSYDLLGRKTSMDDPDKGVWSYTYNSFGELVTQTDAKSQVTEMHYDALGSMIKREDVGALDLNGDGVGDGAGADLITTWDYNRATSGVAQGALATVYNNHEYSKLFSYEGANGRLESTRTRIYEGATYEEFVEKVTYDSYGRTFQSWDAAGGDNAVEHRYNAAGYLSSIVDAVYTGGSPSATYYEVIAQDVFGNVVNEKHGGNITTIREFDPLDGQLTLLQTDAGGGYLQDQRYHWDDVGNLLARSDGGPINSNREDFTYDAMHRLKSSYTNGNSAEAVTLTYDGAGNIVSKTGMGTYTYDPARPHAVTAISGTGETFSYDANGNQTSTYDTGQSATTRLLKYTHYDMVSRIERDGHTSTFEYGPDRGRYRRVDDNPNPTSGGLTETLYLGNVEKVTTPDGTVEFKRRVGNALIVVRQDGSRDITYLMKDHLSSSSLLLEEDGSVRDGYAFDPWGKRRDVSDWDQSLTLSDFMLLDSGTTNRGYTGHEMVDRMGIIHMNGRIYDPSIGRFMQADPFIDGTTTTAGYNRYSYVRNNPLNGTDPTGHFVFTLAIGYALATAPAAVSVSIWTVGSSMAIAGTMDSLMAGSDFNTALQDGALAGISAMAFTAVGSYFNNLSADLCGPGLYEFGGNTLTAGQIGGQIGAHAILGGVLTELRGGNFGHGFVSAGLTKGVMGSSMGMALSKGSFGGRLALYSVLGGTTSKLTGGKFANGAASGAFQFLFNEASTPKYESYFYRSKNVDWRPVFEGGDQVMMSELSEEQSGSISVDPFGSMKKPIGIEVEYEYSLSTDKALMQKYVQDVYMKVTYEVDHPLNTSSEILELGPWEPTSIFKLEDVGLRPRVAPTTWRITDVCVPSCAVETAIEQAVRGK